MDTRNATSEYRASQWVEIIRERQASGDTIKEFCKARGISRDAYFYWQHKLRKAASMSLSKPGEITAAAPAGWLQLSEAGVTKTSLTLEVCGCHITVDPTTDPELLKNVCRILRTL